MASNSTAAALTAKTTVIRLRKTLKGETTTL
jgi:hypothetical protein